MLEALTILEVRRVHLDGRGTWSCAGCRVSFPVSTSWAVVYEGGRGPYAAFVCDACARTLTPRVAPEPTPEPTPGH